MSSVLTTKRTRISLHELFGHLCFVINLTLSSAQLYEPQRIYDQPEPAYDER
uniref:Uncharacterized protein n=1 Tax=Moniliophthora roreri TaxID=221103 RepID=A0A0W0GE85_MONRR